MHAETAIFYRTGFFPRILHAAALLMVFSLGMHAAARTLLQGDIGGMVLDLQGSPYIVQSDLHVPPSSETVVKAGVVMLFHSFTTLIVEGDFIVEGTAEQPVIFTSIHNFNYNHQSEQAPQPFDWNGIDLRENAGVVKMRNFLVSYTVFGIKSRKEEIVLVNGVFSQNGQFNLTIQDKIMLVQEMLSYSYNTKTEPARDSADNATADAKTADAPKKTLTPVQRKLRAASIAALGLTLAEAAATGGLFAGWSVNRERYTTARGSDIAYYYEKTESFRKAGIGAAVGTGITAAAWGTLYYLYKKDLKKTPVTTIKISLPDCFHPASAGFEVTAWLSF